MTYTKRHQDLCLVLMFLLGIKLLVTITPVRSQAENGTISSASALSWSPDGQQLAVSGNFGVALYSSSFQLNGIVTPDPTGAVAWSPDGKLLAIASSDTPSHITVRKTQTDKVLAETSVSKGHIWKLSWSPDSKRIALPTYDQGILVWDIAANKIVSTLTSKSPVEDAAWSPDGKWIAAVGGGTRTVPETNSLINVWDAATGKLDFSIDATATEKFSDITCLAWSPDSKKVALGVGLSEKGSVPILDVASRTLSSGYAWDVEALSFVAWSPDGNHVADASAGVSDGEVSVWEASTFKQNWHVMRPDFNTNFTGGVWSPDNSQLALLMTTLSQDGGQTAVHIFDAQTGKEVTTLELPKVTVLPAP